MIKSIIRLKKVYIYILIFPVIILFIFAGKQNLYAATSFATEASSYGFNINNDYKPRYMNGVREYENLRDYAGDKHFTVVYEVLVRSESNPDTNAFIYKVVTSPYQNRNWGFLGINSYGNNYFNYDIKTNISFPR